MIYFAQLENGAVKIGYSEDVDSRLQGLRSIYGGKLSLLAVLPGDRQREKEIHETFAGLRIGRTEQFRPSKSLMDFIGRPLLVSPNAEAIERSAERSVAVVSLTDSPAYRDWLDGLSRATLIPVATITRDALARWAADRGLPPPPSGPGSQPPRPAGPGPKKGGK